MIFGESVDFDLRFVGKLVFCSLLFLEKLEFTLTKKTQKRRRNTYIIEVFLCQIPAMGSKLNLF